MDQSPSINIEITRWICRGDVNMYGYVIKAIIEPTYLSEGHFSNGVFYETTIWFFPEWFTEWRIHFIKVKIRKLFDKIVKIRKNQNYITKLEKDLFLD